mgnify:CR=1 FL=1
MFKGWRTVLIAIGIAAGTAALQYLLDFDWVNAVGPLFAVIILEGIKIALRLISTGPVGTKL